MTILRTQNKKGNFVILNKTFLQDNNLSLKAKGLLAYLLSLPDDWKIYVNELMRHSTDGAQATRSALNELKQRGYITYVRKRNDSGTFSQGEYIISEEARVTFEASPQTVEPQLENPDMANVSLLRNNTSKDKIKKNTTANIDRANEINRHINSIKQNHAAERVDQLIGRELSGIQQHAIRLTCTELQNFTALSEEELYHSLTASMLDKSAFTQAGSNFGKKLNTLKKCIRNGKWTPVVSHPSKKNHVDPIDHNNSQEQWVARMRELTGNKNFTPQTFSSSKEAWQNCRKILGYKLGQVAIDQREETQN